MSEQKLRYTIIHHEPRKKLGLSMLEYGVCDSIYHLSSNPDYRWCVVSKKQLAEFFGVSVRTIHTILQTLLAKELIEKHPQTKHLRTTQKWYSATVLENEPEESAGKQEEGTSHSVKKLHTKCEETSHLEQPECEETSHNNNNNIYNNNNNNKNTIVEHDKIVFDIRTGEFRNIPNSLLEKWKTAYPAVAIKQELAKASAWLMSNPRNQKKNYARFLTNWLSRAQERARRVGGPPVPDQDDIEHIIADNKEDYRELLKIYEKEIREGKVKITYDPNINSW